LTVKKVLEILIVSLLLVLPAATVSAQGPTDCQPYTIQTGDWLSKIAQKYYGDPLAYDVIVLANNSDNDDDYTDIDNPDVIEPGWVLCIAGQEGEGEETMDMSGSVPIQGAPSPGLTGTTWLLTTLMEQPVPADPPVTVKFDNEGRLSGSSGCNTYSTGYETNPDAGSLTINPIIAATMMACPEPIMQQEQGYLVVLGTTATYLIDGDQLSLLDNTGIIVATFTAQMPVELAGSSWRVLSYNNGKQAVVSVIIGTEMTANFGTDGSLSGSAGCNNYTTTYQTELENITIGPAAATRMACGDPEGIMEQEAAYLTMLTTAAVYRIELNQLEMRTAEGSLAGKFELVETASDQPDETAQVTGTITYLQRSALPSDAVISVQLQDTSLADAPAVVMSEQIIPTEGQQVPFPFAVGYNPDEIQENRTYTLSVRIEDSSGKLLFINTQAYPVLTRGFPGSDIEVIVEPVG
jgi:heat shock protein HslJ